MQSAGWMQFDDSRRSRAVAMMLIVASACLHVLYLTSRFALDLSPDEAHYVDWSHRLDWSYYSKGPLVAYLIRLGTCVFGSWSLEMTGTLMPAVRLPAVICGSLLLLALYILTVQVFRSDRLALGVTALGLTLPLIAAGSTLMTIDSPYTCLWAWALVAGHRAIFRESAWAWPVTGLFIGLGILAKYTMVFWLPCVGLFLLTDPERRRLLFRPGFWVMTGTAFFCCLPILIWNVQHDWVTLHHNLGHAGAKKPIQWLGPINLLATQFALLLGFWFVAWCGAIFEHRPWKETDPGRCYLWWMSAPVFGIFLLFAIKNGGGEPNWPVTTYISGMVLMAGWLANRLTGDLPRTRWLTGIGVTVTCAVGLTLVGVMHFSGLARPVLTRISGPASAERPFPMRRFDPTCRLRGWRHLAAEVDRIRAELHNQGIEPILAGYTWSLPGEISFYCADHPEVYSLGRAMNERYSQYDLWRPNPVSDPDAFRGQTFLVVGIPCQPLFDAFEDTRTRHLVTYQEAGQPIAQWQIIICRGFKGFKVSADGKF